MTSIPTSTTFSFRSLLPARPPHGSPREDAAASTTKTTSSQQQNSYSCSSTSSFPASVPASIATQSASAATVNSPAAHPSQYTHVVLSCLHALRLNDPQISAVAYEFLHPSSSTYTRPLLLQARPGTGKTLTLAARIAFFIAYHRIPPIQILAITFTKQAAAELRQRIDKLTQLIPSPSSSSSVLEACDSAAGVTICNFHQMALLLLRRHSSVFGAQFAWSIITKEETTKVIGELVRQRLIQEEESTAPTSAAALSAEVATQGFTETQDTRLIDHKDRKMTEEEQETMQVIEELEQQHQQYQPDGTVLASSTAKPPTTTAPSLTSILNSSRFAAASFSALVDQQKHKYTTAQVLAMLLKQRQKGLELRRLANSRLMFVTPTTNLDASPEFDEDAETDPVVMDIFHQYDTLLHQRNQLSLADLLPALIALLRYDPSIVQQCQHLFRYIFVDEFQDTTSPDVKALLALIGHPHWDEVKYNRGTQRGSTRSTNMSASSSSSSSSTSFLINHLTVVGDPQQSVYGFRGADGHAFDLLQQALHPYGAISLRLTQNYRSTQTIIQAANSIMEYNACKPPPRPTPADTTTITTTTTTTRTTATGATTTSTTTTTATVPGTTPPVVPTAVSLNGSGAMWSTNPQGAAIIQLVSFDGAAQARSIVEQIQRLTRSDVHQYHQIAVLARTNATVEQLRRCMKEHHIPMHSKRRKSGFSYGNSKKKQRLRVDLGYDDEDEDEDVTDIENVSRRSSPCKAAIVSPRVQAYQKQFTISMKTAEWKEALAYCRVFLSAYQQRGDNHRLLPTTHEVDIGSQLADTSLRYLLTVFSSASVAKQILLSLTDIQEQYIQKQRRRRSKMIKSEPGGSVEDSNDECIRNACDVALVCMEESVRYQQQQPSAATELQQWLRNKVEKTLTKPQYLSLSLILDRIGHLQRAWRQKLQHTNRRQQETAAGLLMSIILQCMQSPEQWLQQSTPLAEKKTSTHKAWVDDDDDDDLILPSFTLSIKQAAHASASSTHTHNTRHIHALQALTEQYKANDDLSLSIEYEPHSSSVSSNNSSSSVTQTSALRSLQRLVWHIDTGNIAELYGLEAELETHKKQQKNSSTTSLVTITPSCYTGVFVSTIHKAKGLEWPVVFVASFNEDELPVPIQHICPRSHNGVEDLYDLDEATLKAYAASGGRVGVGCAQLREEARIAYVAVTRAQVQLFVSYITHDTCIGPMQPSRFLMAIPKHLKQQQQSSQQQQQTHHQSSPARLGEVLTTGMLLFPRTPHPSPEFKPASQLGKRRK